MEDMKRHGGPEDRGGADAYYHRSRNPHYFKGGTSTMERAIMKDQMTDEQIKAYNKGYDNQVASGIFK